MRPLYGDLLLIPPWVHVLGGTLLFAAGCVFTIMLWQAGWVIGVSPAGIGGGVAFVLRGLLRSRTKPELDGQMRHLTDREESQVVKLQREGQAAFRSLDHEGLLDMRIRGWRLAQSENRRGAPPAR
jgi:hypothetical protein